MDIKDKIAANFSAAASHYDQYAVMQQQAALSLVSRLTELRPRIPAGPVLEIGCGTGAVSRELVTLFPDRRLTLLDLAPGMVAMNRETLLPLLKRPELVEWQVQDAEKLTVRNRYALIASCLTLQWFQDLTGTLSRMCQALTPGGFLLCSTLGHNSFPEWRLACHALSLPCTMNPLPNVHQILETVRAMGHEASAWEETIRLPYPTVLDFFRSLKKTGTGTSSAKERLTRSQMERLLSTWEGEAKGAVSVTYEINTILVRA
jgi:malonyl-CoA O-methyltransferase